MKHRYSYLGRIRNNEIPDMVRALIKIVSKHTTEAMGIQLFVDLLVEKESKLATFSELAKKAHPLSDSITEIRKKRLVLIKSILKQKSATESGGISILLETAKDLFPLINKYLIDFSKETTKSADDKLLGFISEWDSSEALRTAAKTLGLYAYVEELKLLQPDLSERVDKRREDNSSRRMTPLIQIREEILTSVTNVLKAIELDQVQHADVDYSALNAELDEFFVPYIASMKTRDTRNKNEVDTNATAATSTKTTAAAN
ncbi:MAG: hypothetical protein RIS29_401 [Bacteroidota bacterium]|jgi:hypothetical protein